MQTQTAPQPPAPARVIRIEEGPGREATTLAMPMTRGEVAEIRARRSELSSQLISASGRREELAEQLRITGTGPDRAGLEQRIGVLDERIVRLESDIAETGRLLTNAPAGLLSTTSGEQVLGIFSPAQTLAFGIVLTIFVLAPLAVGMARMMWKHAAAGPVRHVIPPETAGRLERIEQAVEAIAVEVERVSEGQRFVTKLMSENQKAVPGLEHTRMLPQTHSGER
ncbi:MAG TPA: hypothetical protein VMY38_04935 [Gemmatimonadaceae bacterium]|nr:hypothetical protein [Gemmatimonadaceae bacterium]